RPLRLALPFQQQADRSGIDFRDSGQVDGDLISGNQPGALVEQRADVRHGDRPLQYAAAAGARDHFAWVSILASWDLFFSASDLISPSMPFLCTSEVNVPR